MRSKAGYSLMEMLIVLAGIAIGLAGVVLLIAWSGQWYWGLGALVLGYLLQWIGHTVEGNDVGEWAGIKRLLGLPYVSIAPRWQQQQAAGSGQRAAEE